MPRDSWSAPPLRTTARRPEGTQGTRAALASELTPLCLAPPPRPGAGCPFLEVNRGMEAVLATIKTAQALCGPLRSGYTWEWPADHLFPSRRISSSCFKFLRVSLETSANEMYRGLRLVSELPGSLQKVL